MSKFSDYRLAVLALPAIILATSITCAQDSRIIDSLLLARLVGATPASSYFARFTPNEIKLTPILKSGYRRMGMDVKIPVPFDLDIQGAPVFKGESAKLRLPDVNLWIIEAGFDARFSRSFTFGFSGASNLLQNLATRLGGYVDSEVETRLRKGHPLNWIEADLSISYFFHEPFAVVAGLRWDYFDLNIRDPSALARVNIGPHPNVGLSAGEVLSNLWIPYLGAEFVRENMRIKLIGSLAGWANVKVNSSFRGDMDPPLKIWGSNLISMSSAPYFIEAGVEYDITLAEKTNLNLWGKAGWLGASGGGRLTGSFGSTNTSLTVGILDDRDVSYSRYSLAGGVAVKAAF